MRWRDACYEPAEDSGLVKTQLVELDEVGWLVAENEEAVTLAMELEPGEDGTPSSRAGRCRLHIPRVNILEMRVVDSPKKAFNKGSVVIG